VPPTNGNGVSGGTGGLPAGQQRQRPNRRFLHIGGAADSEEQLPRGSQDTENNSGGYFPKPTFPFEFIQEVEKFKTSGIEAEARRALSAAVINVIMKKGSNAYHGELFATYETFRGWTRTPRNAFLAFMIRMIPGNSLTGQDSRSTALPGARKDHFRILRPGVSLGGPIVKDRLFFFGGLCAPDQYQGQKTVNFGPNDNNAWRPILYPR